MSPNGSPVRVAYLASRYPHFSHTFIEREVAGLRSLGAQVRTFTIRRGDAPAPGTPDAEATIALLAPGAPLDLLFALARSPRGALRALRFGIELLRRAGGGPRAVARHLAYLGEAARLARRMERLGLRHVHAHFGNNGAVVAALAAAWDRRLSFSLSVHGWIEFHDPWRRALAPLAARAAWIRCVSRSGLEELERWAGPVARARAVRVPCGIELAFWNEAAVPRPRRRADEAPFQVISVGRLAPEKDFATLLRALAALGPELPWQLQVAGDGPEGVALKELARTLGIERQVRWLGALPPARVRELLAGADAFVLPSLREGLPVALMEAMAAGVPVVSTRIAGIPELVVEGETGWLVEPGDAAGIAEALREIVADGPRVRETRERAKEKVSAEFALEESVRRMARLLAEGATAASARGPGPAGEATGP